MAQRLFGYSGTAINIPAKFKEFYDIILLLGTVILSTISTFALENDIFKYTLFSISIFFIIIGSIGATLDKIRLKKENDELKKFKSDYFKIDRKLRKLTEENFKLNSQIIEKDMEIVKNLLKSFFNEINLTNDDRLTIYYEHNKEFTLFSRFSSHTTYNDVHTQKFTLNQGVISKTWNLNTYTDISAPIFQNDSEAYYSYMKICYDFTQERLEKMNMKPNKFYGIAIQEADDNIGVILYEKVSSSEDCNFVDNCDKIRNKCEKYSSYLIKYIKNAIENNSMNFDTNNKENAEQELLKKLGEKNNG